MSNIGLNSYSVLELLFVHIWRGELSSRYFLRILLCLFLLTKAVNSAYYLVQRVGR